MFIQITKTLVSLNLSTDLCFSWIIVDKKKQLFYLSFSSFCESLSHLTTSKPPTISVNYLWIEQSIEQWTLNDMNWKEGEQSRIIEYFLYKLPKSGLKWFLHKYLNNASLRKLFPMYIYMGGLLKEECHSVLNEMTNNFGWIAYLYELFLWTNPIFSP